VGPFARYGLVPFLEERVQLDYVVFFLFMGRTDTCTLTQTDEVDAPSSATRQTSSSAAANDASTTTANEERMFKFRHPMATSRFMNLSYTTIEGLIEPGELKDRGDSMNLARDLTLINQIITSFWSFPSWASSRPSTAPYHQRFCRTASQGLMK